MKNGTYTVVINGKEMKISVSENKASDTDSDVVEEKPHMTVPESDYENKMVDSIRPSTLIFKNKGLVSEIKVLSPK